MSELTAAMALSLSKLVDATKDAVPPKGAHAEGPQKAVGLARNRGTDLRLVPAAASEAKDGTR